MYLPRVPSIKILEIDELICFSHLGSVSTQEISTARPMLNSLSSLLNLIWITLRLCGLPIYQISHTRKLRVEIMAAVLTVSKDYEIVCTI